MASEEGSSGKVIPVRVAVRLRPLSAKEIREGCQECIDISSDSPQVVVRGTDKAFTYDYAYPTDSTQRYIYETSIKNVVQNLFKGYNVTVLAYGQTGSGKTHTMGTSYFPGVENSDDAGIIPRAVHDIFEGVASQTDNDCMIKVSFIELYKETLFDLLSNKSNKEECAVDIREDARGGIKIVGLTEVPVTSIRETMLCLEQGALHRATGATAMNAHSSRSHAIFSMHVEQRNKKKGESAVCAKFHLVDLAGSERAKKTGATGERFKEGVNINKGLLALGNVISALCDDGGRGGHIPYRDSKLTRLLQDSLGGNSHTVMVACVSPADSNLEESLSTLRYSDRARKIKNKPIVNRDPQAAELMKLREQVMQLQIQLLASNGSTGGSVPCSGNEINSLLNRNRALQEEINQLTQALQTALDENTNMAEKAIMAELSRERLKVKMEELLAQTGVTYDALNKTLDVTTNPQHEGQLNLVKDLQAKIVDLQSEQNRGAKAIMDHELSRHNISTNTSIIPHPDTSNKDAPCSEMQQEGSSPEEIPKEFGTEFTLRQAKLNEELQGLNRALAMKEELMNKMSVNDTQFVAMREQYEKEKKNLEVHIDILSKEKDELMQQLKVAGSASSKVSEQRRKKVQELEAQIGVLRQKQKEQVKLLRMKEQSEQKVNKLNAEIQAMKATRVKLIRQMKEDSEKFRVWKTQKDREVARLKEADRQKQYQIVKMERLHSKKQNVLRRKMEEAIAINKRLKDAMALQKAGSEKRAASKDIAGTGNRIRSWLEGELEVVAVKKQAKQSLEVLIDNRKSICTDISKTKKEINNGDPNSAGVKELNNKLADLESCLQLRTAQISDLQAKFVDDDEDDSNRKRFESMQSMLEAKCAMNYLFEVATKHQMTIATQEADMKDLQSQYDELAQSLDATEVQLKELREAHQEERTRLEREHEEKVLFLLGQMSKAESQGPEGAQDKDSTLREQLKLQEEEIARLTHLHELLQNKTKECEELKKQLAEKATGMVTPILGDVKNNRRRTYVQAKPAGTKKVTQLLADFSESESEPEEEEEDQKQDPDWRKTPLFRKIRKITQGMDTVTKEEAPAPRKKSTGKRDSNGEIKCKCKGDCSMKICSCCKNEKQCSMKCNCDTMKCKNRSYPESPNSESTGETCLNSTFDITPMPLKENVAKKPRIEMQSSLFNNSDELSDENSHTASQRTIKSSSNAVGQRTFTSSPDMF